MMLIREINVSPTSPGMALARITTGFVAGALLWKAWHLAGEPRSIRFDVLAALMALATLVGLAVVPDGLGYPLLMTPFVAAFVIGVAGSTGLVHALFVTRPMLWIGKISYSLYMVHVPVIVVLGTGVPVFSGSHLVVRLSILGFLWASCVFAAYVLFRLVETPSRRLIRRRFRLGAPLLVADRVTAPPAVAP